MRQQKANEKLQQSAAVLFPPSSVVVDSKSSDVAFNVGAFTASPEPDYANYVFPPMPPPASLVIYGQQVYPLEDSPPSPSAPQKPLSQIPLPKTPSAPQKPLSQIPPPKTPSAPKTFSRIPPPKTPSAPPKTIIGKKRKAVEKASPSSSDLDSDSGGSAHTDDEALKNSPTGKKTKMSRISKDEREAVDCWITKSRGDGKMTNGRWIRNGGAKGATMTATSGEVKTSGAWDALATYVNKKLQLRFTSKFYWTRGVAKKRWISL